MLFDIFLSYRREGGYETAKHLYDLLTHDGYSVSFDIDTLKRGDFDKQLLSRIDACKDFILIVDKHCFDRTLDGSCKPEQDWLRCELAHALAVGKNVIPIFLAGNESFPNDLPDDLNAVTTKNGPKYNREYFDAFYCKLKEDFLLSKPNIFDGNNYSLKKALWFVVISLVLLLILFGLLFRNQNKRRLADEFDALVYVADSLVLVEKQRLLNDSTIVSINTKTLTHANASYSQALKLDVYDDKVMDVVISKADMLNVILDSCEVYENNAQMIQTYLLEQRIASAERLKLRQSELTDNIIKLIKEL